MVLYPPFTAILSNPTVILQSEVSSSEVTKCDTNISPRRLIIHLLH
jgi:hypothetical protein